MLNFFKLILLALAFIVSAVRAGGYSDSCYDCALFWNGDGVWLRCMCYDNNGVNDNSFKSIDLDQCIVNDNGVLRAQAKYVRRSLSS